MGGSGSKELSFSDFESTNKDKDDNNTQGNKSKSQQISNLSKSQKTPNSQKNLQAKKNLLLIILAI